MLITLKNGEKKEFQSGLTAGEISILVDENNAAVALAAKVNGEVVDLNTVVSDDCEFSVLTFNDPEGKKVYRHTAAHVLAQAITNIYPTAKLGVGHADDNGFYYDFDFRSPITMDDLPHIESEMKKIISADLKIEKFATSKSEALRRMRELGEDYKIELINEIAGRNEEISFYRQGEFVDMCKEVHLQRTGAIKAFRLTSLTGAYWRGNDNNKMLTRIYGTAFDDEVELEKYLKVLEEAKLRDHNKIGRDLGYFTSDEDVGHGLPLLKPKGAKLMQILQRFVEDEEERRGYYFTKTPIMAKSSLYKVSGHWEHYKDKMFIIGDEQNENDVLALRPMTCPFQFKIYNDTPKSYRELPVRYSETATLCRNEVSGEMHGLIRIRQFTLSDGHIICTPDQLESEFLGCVDLLYYVAEALGIKDELTFRFARRNKNDKKKYINDNKAWERSEKLMKKILDDTGIDYVEAVGEAAFYGPKLDVQYKNVYGKEDTLFTIQIDFALAERFNMTYIDEDGEKQRPYIIHRSSIGCYERTIAMLLEKYAGALPIWMSPVQVKVMSLTERTAETVKAFAQKLRVMGIRADFDVRNEKIGYKVRAAQLEKTPYMVIIGDKEQSDGNVSVRSRKDGDLGVMTEDEFIGKILTEVAKKVC